MGASRLPWGSFSTGTRMVSPMVTLGWLCQPCHDLWHQVMTPITFYRFLRQAP